MGIARLLTTLMTLAFFACTGYAKNASIDEARTAARQGDWILAMQITQKALIADPGNADGLALQGDYHWANGDSSRAAESYEKALRNNPKHPGAIINLTQYYVQTKQLGEAERIVADAESKDIKGKVDEVRAARGILYAAQDNFAEATKVLVSLATKRPENPLYPQLLARLYNAKGVKEQAVQYYKQASDLNPGDMDLAYEYALLLQDLKEYETAMTVMKVVQGKNMDNKSVDFMIGRLYFAVQNWGEAARNLQFAVDKRPDHFLSQFLLGQSLVAYSKAEKKNLYRNAELPLRTAKDLRPGRKDVEEALNQLLEIEGRLNLQLALGDSVATRTAAYCDTSLTYFRELSLNDPAFKGVHANMAKVWAKLGVPDSTAFYCAKELERYPDDAPTLSRLVNTLQRKKDQAGLTRTLRPYFDKLSWTAAPDSGNGSPRSEFLSKFGYVLASAYYEQGQLTVARELLTSMLAYKPTWKEGQMLNAQLDLSRNDYSSAIPLLQKAVEALPSDPDLWVLLGDSWYFSNPKNRPTVLKAKDCYQRASQLGSRDGTEKFRQLGAVK
jgi:tetratricopeptide (TPR) repeat protein